MPRDICGLCGFGQFLHKDETEAEEEEEKSKKVVEALHNIFRLFLLTRVKSNVEKNLLPSTCFFFFFFAKAVFALLICLFRRTEKEINIYVRLTEMQRKWYQSVLEKDINAVDGKYNCYFFLRRHLIIFAAGLAGKKEGKTCLMVMVMQVSSHLQSFSSADPVCVQL
jgi:SWI/SNF-related matrix-associated actin-dependent regulator of chromatin subfamily A member 5